MDNNTAIQILREARQKIVEESSKQLSEIDQSIQSLLRQAGSSISLVDSTITVKPGQYRNMKGPAALQAYLSERPGAEVPIAKAVADLQVGGAFLGDDPKRHERVLKIGISNNTSRFVLNEETDTVRLIPGVGPKVRKKKKTKS